MKGPAVGRGAIAGDRIRKFFHAGSMYDAMMTRAVVFFRGRVQGVYFRAHCAEKAQELGLSGFVQNRADGSVEAVFEGDRPGIEACIDWNKTSQPYARVDSMEVAWVEPKGDVRGFHVRH
ncbi:MAG: acylphosphatase [Thermoplasmata archaeon]